MAHLRWYLVGVVIVFMIIVATVDEIANGANFSLVPHCNPGSNGLMTGIVGAMGNLGGVWFALVFRFQPSPFGKAFWIAGIVTIVCRSRFSFHERRVLISAPDRELRAGGHSRSSEIDASSLGQESILQLRRMSCQNHGTVRRDCCTLYYY